MFSTLWCVVAVCAICRLLRIYLASSHIIAELLSNKHICKDATTYKLMVRMFRTKVCSRLMLYDVLAVRFSRSLPVDLDLLFALANFYQKNKKSQTCTSAFARHKDTHKIRSRISPDFKECLRRRLVGTVTGCAACRSVRIYFHCISEHSVKQTNLQICKITIAPYKTTQYHTVL